MEWALKRSIWREDNLYVSHCEDLEIASQGEPVDEARANLEEAIQLFSEVASFSEVMAYLPCFGPVSTPELQGQPKKRFTSTLQESQKIKGVIYFSSHSRENPGLCRNLPARLRQIDF